MKTRILLPALLSLTLLAAPAGQLSTFSEVTPQTDSHGFRAKAVYLNDAGQPFGARFTHARTGFTPDLIQVQSVPQAFVWVNSWPVSDKGEPHTQEHLLLGKGNMGRAFSASETMSLTQENAFTQQWRTCYHFNTKAGLPVFYEEFRFQLDAMLHPDYTDEEIRREVRNFGVSANPATKDLRLEEKGSVYNEMTSSSNNPMRVLYRQFEQDVYGSHHPLSYNSGGEPSGIREMQPEDIRRFHRENYFLGNMGAIASLPKGETLETQLAHFDSILTSLQPQPSKLRAKTEADLPQPQPAAAGSVQVAEFPFQNDQQPGFIGLGWPANRELNEREALLLGLFLDSVAGDSSTDLYRMFINSSTRKLDLGANRVLANLSDDQGRPLLIGFGSVATANLTAAKVMEVRTMVTAELARISALPDGSPEVTALNALVRGRLAEEGRQLSKLVNSPPGFGARNTFSTWMEHLDHLNREPGFQRSVTRKPDVDALIAQLAGSKNIWRDLLPKWKITGVVPYGIAVKPSPALLKQQQQERAERAGAEAKRLASKFGVSGDQEAIRRYKADYDAESARLDKLASAAQNRFIDNPPLTLDDSLEYKESKTANGVPVVSSYFDNMSSATTAIAFRLDTVPEADLPLLSLLPSLLTQTGVIDNGNPVSNERMEEMLRTEILGLNASFISNVKSNRVELLLRGSGNNLAESQRAIEWMRLALEHPDWRMENLPRLRDLTSQTVSRLRATMQGSEESWVMNPVLSYWKQTNPLYLTTSSFLTRAWNADRLRWMLAEIPDRPGVAAALAKLAEAGPARAAMKEAAASIAPKELSIDLTQLLADLPEASLAADWRYVCTRLREDILTGPEKTLARLNTLRAGILDTSNARLWMVGSRANLAKLQPAFTLASSHPARVTYGPARRIDARLREHQGDRAVPRFVGLYNENMTGGVIASIVPFTSYDDVSRESQLSFLASRLFAGYGAHAVFSKTIGAGLAYSNGIRGSLHDGYAGYYAERTPEVPQTLRFVVDVVKNGPRDAALTEYVIAQAFGDSYASNSYEDRAQAIADDLTDGVTPLKVKQFREAMLALRRDPNLANEIFARVDATYGRIVPGYGTKAKDAGGAAYYMIGGDRQFTAMDADVQTREDEHVYKLYPRDYWLVD